MGAMSAEGQLARRDVAVSDVDPTAPEVDPLSTLATLLAALDDVDLAGRYGLADRVLPRGAVLDAGCGDGRGAAVLARGGRNVIAVDRDPSPFGVPGVQLTRGDLTALDLADGAVGGIACLDVLDESDAPDAIVAELRRVLAPDGVVLVSARDGEVFRSAAAIEAVLRRAFPHVRRSDGGLATTWRTAGAPVATGASAMVGNGDGAAVHAERTFFLAAPVAGRELDGIALPGPALDLGTLRTAWTDAVQQMRVLRNELAAVRRDLAQMTELRARLAEAEQEISRLPDLRGMLARIVAERDQLHEVLGDSMRARGYPPQLAVVVEALRDLQLEVGDDLAGALRVLLRELDRRPDLQAAFTDDGRLRVHDLLLWVLRIPPDDGAMALMRPHLPVLGALAKRLRRGQAVVVPFSAG